MKQEKRQFLTLDQAIDAIRSDFEQHPHQANLFSTLWPLIFGEDAYLMRDPDGKIVWAKTPSAKKPFPIQADALGRRIVVHLRRHPVSPEQMARIATRVFQTVVEAGQAPGSDSLPGIWVDVSMDTFVCTRCGHCCRSLTYHDGCSVADYRHWQDLGRTDILDWVGTIYTHGQLTACRIWMRPGSNQFADSCPWLETSPDQDRYRCSIHDVRPTICRQYPGSRKHARLTGCRGV